MRELVSVSLDAPGPVWKFSDMAKCMRSMIGRYHALQLESEECFVLLNLSCDLRCPLLAGNAVCHVGMTARDDVCETS